jgi:hypothetical protein
VDISESIILILIKGGWLGLHKVSLIRGGQDRSQYSPRARQRFAILKVTEFHVVLCNICCSKNSKRSYVFLVLSGVLFRHVLQLTHCHQKT